MSQQLITPPASAPIDVAEARQQVRQDGTFDDAILKLCILAARESVETKTQCQIIGARWKMTIDSFCGYEIRLPRCPVLEVESIQYIDMGGVLQTVAPEDYKVDYSSEPVRITPVFGKIWPIPLPQIGSVMITYSAGFAAPFTADAAADTIALKGWKPLNVGDVIRLSNSGGALPAPLLPDTDYSIGTVVSPGIYKLLLNAAQVDITSAGTGLNFVGVVPEGIKTWMLLRIGTLYENREDTIALQRGTIHEMPFFESLLDSYRIMEY